MRHFARGKEALVEYADRSISFFNAEHDELIEICIFSKNWCPACICSQIIRWEVKNSKFENNNKWGLRDAK